MVKLAVAFLLPGGLLLSSCQVPLAPPTDIAATTAPAITATQINEQEVDVPFETIAQGETGKEVVDTLTAMRLQLLTSNEQTQGFETLVTPQALADLRRVDFERYIVVALLQGVQTGTNYQTVIEGITRQNNRLIAHTQVSEPSSQNAVTATYNSSYHLVRIERRHIPSQDLVLVLQAQMLTPTSRGAPTAAATFSGSEVDVPFVTIALTEGVMNIPYDESWSKPRLLLLLTSPEQISQIESWVSPQTLAALQQVDFEHHAVVALFRGRQGSTNYQTIIERITRRDDHLIVYAQFWEPNSKMASGAAITAPYHLVRIDKQQVPGPQSELALQAQMLTPIPPENFLFRLFK